jgi:hypothetical protein
LKNFLTTNKSLAVCAVGMELVKAILHQLMNTTIQSREGVFVCANVNVTKKIDCNTRIIDVAII